MPCQVRRKLFSDILNLLVLQSLYQTRKTEIESFLSKYQYNFHFSGDRQACAFQNITLHSFPFNLKLSICNIRSLQANDQEEVIEILTGYLLQFPKFIIEKYPIRWNDFLTSSTEKNKSQFIVVFNEDNEIVGHAGYLFNSEVGLYENVGVVIKKGVQHHGIGKALISEICNNVREMNEKEIILHTLGHAGNKDTIICYQNIGFDQIKYEKDFYRSGYHSVAFMRNLFI